MTESGQTHNPFAFDRFCINCFHDIHHLWNCSRISSSDAKCWKSNAYMNSPDSKLIFLLFAQLSGNFRLTKTFYSVDIMTRMWWKQSWRQGEMFINISTLFGDFHHKVSLSTLNLRLFLRVSDDKWRQLSQQSIFRSSRSSLASKSFSLHKQLRISNIIASHFPFSTTVPQQ